ncbi:MAG: radical SAM/SPASM domain-containing protein [Candidatus Aenigmatarchaeota archaeon]
MGYKLNLVKQYLMHLLSYELNYPFSQPTEINFQMTNRCPLRCKMCNIPDNKKDKEELTVGELKDVVDEVVEWNENEKYVSFVGGEALVRKEDTLEMIDYCKEKGLHTTLVTSGVLMDEELCQELIEIGLDRIAFSIDGNKAETHNEIRGEEVYGKAIKQLDKMLELRNGNPKVDVNTVIMKQNFEELPDIHEMVREKGVDEIFYQAVVPDNTYKNKADLYNSEVWIDKDEEEKLKEVVEELKELKEKHGMINNSKRYLDSVPDYFVQKEEFEPGKCLAGYMGLNIDPYGDISICGFGPNINVKDGNIEELWKSEEFRETREKIKNCSRPCLMLCYRKASLTELVDKIRG